MQINSDGSFFYKITSGFGLMQHFPSTISVNDRWQLVNFIQNYSPDHEQVLLELPPIRAKLLASVNEALGSVDIMAEFEDANAVYVPLLNAPVTISAKKAFGSMKIGETVTNDQGRAIYTIPENTMGDEQGYLSIVVSLSDEYEAAEVILENALVGSAKEVPGLIRKGVLWSTNNNVSLWVLISYLLAAAGAWMVIIYVIVQIVKIKKYSRTS